MIAGIQTIPAISFLAVPFRVALITCDEVARDGYLVIKNRRVLGVRRMPPKGAAIYPIAGNVIIPGLINAHAHLRFTHLRNSIPAGLPFDEWIVKILRAPLPRAADALRGAREMLRNGIVAAGDYDADGLGARAMQRSALGGVAFREFLAFDASITKKPAREALRSSRRMLIKDPRPGIAPHAPYTVSFDQFNISTRAPVSMHFMETPQERNFIEKGTGTIAELLARRGRLANFKIPYRKPLQFLKQSRIFANGAALVHCNALTRFEIRELAEHKHFTAVHCAGTHRYFARGDAPVRDWIREKLQFALGTDSLASNDRLDLFHEMALLRESDARIGARDIVRAATEGGARALSMRGWGTLRRGCHAAFVALDIDMKTSSSGRFLDEDLFEALTSRPAVVGVVRAT
ncbi:MAG: amidohydrolase family protein [Planctomycetes bacterium]|nr:amidohydrolase family protein [Planctomycetota bacterium]